MKGLKDDAFLKEWRKLRVTAEPVINKDGEEEAPPVNPIILKYTSNGKIKIIDDDFKTLESPIKDSESSEDES